MLVFTIKCKTVRPIDKLWNHVHGHGSNLKLPKGIRIWINSVTREVGDTQWRFWKASDGMPKPPANCGRFMDAGNSKGGGNLETSKLDLRSRAARTGSSHQGDIRSRETSMPAQVTEIHPFTFLFQESFFDWTNMNQPNCYKMVKNWSDSRMHPYSMYFLPWALRTACWLSSVLSAIVLIHGGLARPQLYIYMYLIDYWYSM